MRSRLPLALVVVGFAHCSRPSVTESAATLAATSSVPFGGDGCSVQGYLIEQHGTDGSISTSLSSLGSVVAQTPAGRASPARGAIVRYADERVLLLDYGTSTFQSSSLDDAIAASKSEQGATAPTQIGGTPPTLPTVEKLAAADKIQGIVVRQYVVRDDATNRTARLSFAENLPRPPLAIRQKLAQLQRMTTVKPPSAVDQLDAEPIDQQISGRALLRSEVLVSGTWQVVIDTDSVQKVMIPCSEYSVPDGWQAQTAGSLPAAPARLGLTPKTMNLGVAGGIHPNAAATVGSGMGPYARNPEVHVFFWGQTFADPNHAPAVDQLFQSLAANFDANYNLGLLKSYAVNPGHMGGALHIVNDNPPFDEGGPLFIGYTSAFIVGQYLSGNGPLFWYRTGGDDPVYFIYLPGAVVDSGTYKGIHFLAANIINAFVPFPLNLAVHEGIPFALQKIDQVDMDLQLEELSNRDDPACAVVDDPNPPEHPCKVVYAFDGDTNSASHEYVEMLTDPFPFFGYTDPSQFPDGEIADICQHTAPWSAFTRVGDTVLATYWSELDEACVPNSLPSISIFSPTNGAVIPWQPGGAQVVAHAFATDPIDGPNFMSSHTQFYLDNITFQGDGMTPLPSGNTVTLTHLGIGTHTLSATANDHFGGSASAAITFTVSAQAPVATILSPSNGATFASDDTIVLRGDGFDFAEGELPDSDLSWLVNNNPLIASGRLVQTHITTQGPATITLLVRNSAGITATASVNVTIGPAAGNPTVVITSPKNGAQFGGPQTITFQASGTDSSGNALPDSAYVWTSDIDGVLGTGATLSAPVSGGACGIEIENITVTVTTSGGKTASDTITIYVGKIC